MGDFKVRLWLEKPFKFSNFSTLCHAAHINRKCYQVSILHSDWFGRRTTLTLPGAEDFYDVVGRGGTYLRHHCNLGLRKLEKKLKVGIVRQCLPLIVLYTMLEVSVQTRVQKLSSSGFYSHLNISNLLLPAVRIF